MTHQLSERFQMLIDSAAMQLGFADADAYLAEWRRGEVIERPGTAGAVAAEVAREIEDRFPEFIGRAFRLP